MDRTYVHGGRVDEIVASAAGAGPWLYHHFDARGHCIMLTSSTGGIVEQYEYDAFGQPYVYNASGALVNRKFGSPAGNRFLFTGQEWIVDMRVYDFRARLYQPELGRFLQPDPQEFAAGDDNLYRYCHNDPINKSDPTGLREQIVGDIIWDMARYADSANTSQGSFSDFTNRAYMGDSRATTASGQQSRLGHHHPQGRGSRGPSESDAPLRMTPQPQLVNTEDGPYEKTAYNQLMASDGKTPLSGGNLKFQEVTTQDVKETCLPDRDYG